MKPRIEPLPSRAEIFRLDQLPRLRKIVGRARSALNEAENLQIFDSATDMATVVAIYGYIVSASRLLDVALNEINRREQNWPGEERRVRREHGRAKK